MWNILLVTLSLQIVIISLREQFTPYLEVISPPNSLITAALTTLVSYWLMRSPVLKHVNIKTIKYFPTCLWELQGQEGCHVTFHLLDRCYNQMFTDLTKITK